jgi:integrase
MNMRTRALREIGLPVGRKSGGYVIHELRHTMVSEWIHAGEPEKAIMSLTGHKAVARLHRYGHTSAEAQRAAQERVAMWRARQLWMGSKPTRIQNTAGSGE